MNLRDLKYLVALADHKHFGRAAAACFISQPTLSTQIRKLEDELGVPLVDRTTRRVKLTSAGADLVERAVGSLTRSTPPAQPQGSGWRCCRVAGRSA